MSFSRVFAIARAMAIAMGRTTMPVPANNPVAKGFAPKHVAITCRRCDGSGFEPLNEKKKLAPNVDLTIRSIDDCQQCRGLGVEKLSIKRIIALQKSGVVIKGVKLAVPAKTVSL